MTTKLNLASGIHYYQSKRYDEAIRYFSALKATEISNQEVAIINIWIGKCYFNKEKPYTASIPSIHPSLIARKSGRFSAYPYSELSNHSVSLFRKMIEEALTHFEVALETDSKSGLAYYWKGKALDYQGAKDEAYVCFARAAFLSNNQKYREIVCRLFSENLTFPFQAIIPLDSMTLEQALESCYSANTYLRMEACQYISTLDNLPPESIDQIKEALSHLAGLRVLCCYIPCTGDPDKRVQKKAQFILLNLGRA